MNEYETDGMVALLPIETEWARQPLPHMTVIYIEDVRLLTPSSVNELAKDILIMAQHFPQQTVKVLGVETFGDDEPVDVLRLAPTPTISAMNKLLREWDDSKYPEYKPHATIGPVGSLDAEPPLTLTFDKIMLALGEQNFVFDLVKPEFGV